MLMLLTGGNRYAARELWLRKVRIHMEAPVGGVPVGGLAVSKYMQAPVVLWVSKYMHAHAHVHVHVHAHGAILTETFVSF